MDGFDKGIAGFLGLWLLLLVAGLVRSLRERRPIRRSVFLSWLNVVFITLFNLSLHHPAFRYAHPIVAWAIWFGWGGCAIGWALSRKASEPAV